MDDKTLQQVQANRRRRPRVRPIGELAWQLTPAFDSGKARKLMLLEPLWKRTLPQEVSDKIHLESLEKGCIYVTARDTSSRFLVERVIGPTFIRAIQAAYPDWGVTRLKVVLGGTSGA